MNHPSKRYNSWWHLVESAPSLFKPLLASRLTFYVTWERLIWRVFVLILILMFLPTSRRYLLQKYQQRGYSTMADTQVSAGEETEDVVPEQPSPTAAATTTTTTFADSAGPEDVLAQGLVGLFQPIVQKIDGMVDRRPRSF
jgi:hypothetical protein